MGDRLVAELESDSAGKATCAKNALFDADMRHARLLSSIVLTIKVSLSMKTFVFYKSIFV